MTTWSMSVSRAPARQGAPVAATERTASRGSSANAAAIPAAPAKTWRRLKTCGADVVTPHQGYGSPKRGARGGRQTGGVPSWSDVTEAAPELAERVEERFQAHGLAVMATIRADGSPRLSGI